MIKFKKLLTALSITTLSFSLTFTTFAHSGRTDSSGGHTVTAVGSSHYHKNNKMVQHFLIFQTLYNSSYYLLLLS